MRLCMRERLRRAMRVKRPMGRLIQGQRLRRSSALRAAPSPHRRRKKARVKRGYGCADTDKGGDSCLEAPPCGRPPPLAPPTTWRPRSLAALVGGGGSLSGTDSGSVRSRTRQMAQSQDVADTTPPKQLDALDLKVVPLPQRAQRVTGGGARGGGRPQGGASRHEHPPLSVSA